MVLCDEYSAVAVLTKIRDNLDRESIKYDEQIYKSKFLTEEKWAMESAYMLFFLGV